MQNQNNRNAPKLAKWFLLNYKKNDLEIVSFWECSFFEKKLFFFHGTMKYHFNTWLYWKILWYCKYVGIHGVHGNWWFHQSTSNWSSRLFEIYMYVKMLEKCNYACISELKHIWARDFDIQKLSVLKRTWCPYI